MFTNVYGKCTRKRCLQMFTNVQGIEGDDVLQGNQGKPGTGQINRSILIIFQIAYPNSQNRPVRVLLLLCHTQGTP